MSKWDEIERSWESRTLREHTDPADRVWEIRFSLVRNENEDDLCTALWSDNHGWYENLDVIDDRLNPISDKEADEMITAWARKGCPGDFDFDFGAGLVPVRVFRSEYEGDDE